MADGHKRITIPYRPRGAFKAYHARTQRWASLVIHRRGGKTVATINDLNRAAITNQRAYPPPRYGYIAPFYNQAKRIAWGYAKHYADPIPGREFNESELKITYPNGAELRLFGADNPDALRGDYLDGVVCDEFADWHPDVYPLVIRPMLADYKGWATFIGTPKGRNAFHEQHNYAEANPAEWFSMVLRASESGLIAKEELDDLRASMSEDQYAQEFECSFDAAVLGAYYARLIEAAEREGRVTHVPHDRALKVSTWWDLGKRDATSIWFVQTVAGQAKVIDYLEARGLELDDYAQQVTRKPYVYDYHYLPHDARASILGMKHTREAQLKSLLGEQRVRITEEVPQEDGRNAVRIVLPKCWFDAEKCATGIKALRHYHAKYNEKLNILSAEPEHDWSSHGADAFRYFAVTWKPKLGLNDKPKDYKPAVRRNDGWAGGW